MFEKIGARKVWLIGFAVGLALTCTAAAADVASIANPPYKLTSPLQETQTWKFRVMLGKREIGFHEFTVSRDEHSEQVEINARFDVKVLFFKAYSYDHQNKETWRNGCLDSIQSTTDDNGQLFSVHGTTSNKGFVVNTNVNANSLDSSCVRSFAYWNRDYLDANELLNAQTGESLGVSVSEKVEEMLSINNIAVPAYRYELSMEDGTIALWYARGTGQWLALEAPAPGGRVLRYEPVALPLPLPGANRLAMQ